MNEDGRKDLVGIDRWSEALSWHDALREADEKELTNALGREWQGWYADGENRRVFDHVSRLLADRDLYRKRRRRSGGELEGDAYDPSVPITEWQTGRALQKTWRPHARREIWWRMSGGIAVTAIVVLVALSVLPFRVGSPFSHAVYQTEVGGIRDVHLTDGSAIILGGRTKLSVAFSGQRRFVNVIEGQAWFKVAHDPQWPFVVAAGDGTITDIGTAFLVTRDSDRVLVTVIEGEVEVSARQPVRPSVTLGRGIVLRPALAPIRVTRGQQITLSDAGALGSPKQTDTHTATAWTHGSLTFDNQPLRYVIETINRYSSRGIFASAPVGALRFSGIVYADDIGEWLQSLEVIFPITVDDRGASVRIRMRHPAAASKLP